MQVAIVGSGTTASALARALHARGDHVAVLSPEPTALPALWMRCDAVTGEGLRRGVKGCEVVVFAAGAQRGPAVVEVARMGAQHTASAALHAGAARFVVLGPTGASPSAQASSLRAHHEGVSAARRQLPGLVELRLPWLFGEGDHLLEPWLERARRGQSVGAPRLPHPLRPLWVGDAVKVLLRLVDGRLDRPLWSLQGPERHTLPELAQLVRQRLGVKAPWWGGGPDRPEDLLRLPEQLEAPDDWAELGLGERVTVPAWLERWWRQHLA